MKTLSIKINATEGLHGKNASTFIDCALRFESDIWVECNEKRYRAKSLMGMLALHVYQGDNIRIIAEGVDEEEAVNELSELCRTNFIDKSVIERIRARQA